MTPQEEQFKAQYDELSQMVDKLPPEKRERGAQYLTDVIKLYNDHMELFGDRK